MRQVQPLGVRLVAVDLVFAAEADWLEGAVLLDLILDEMCVGVHVRACACVRACLYVRACDVGCVSVYVRLRVPVACLLLVACVPVGVCVPVHACVRGRCACALYC